MPNVPPVNDNNRITNLEHSVNVLKTETQYKLSKLEEDQAILYRDLDKRLNELTLRLRKPEQPEQPAPAPEQPAISGSLPHERKRPLVECEHFWHTDINVQRLLNKCPDCGKKKA